MINERKLLILLCLLSFCFCYFEWGGGHSGLLIGIEYSLLIEGAGKGNFMTHPFVLMPLMGQILLLTALLFRRFSGWLSFAGLVLCSTLAGLLLLGGIISGKLVATGSTIPFWVFAILLIRRLRADWKQQSAADVLRKP